jgi:hypothetical protein
MFVRIQPHLFWDYTAYRKDPSGKVYYIRNSSKTKIRNRRRLKRLYMLNLWDLILSFDEDDDTEMTVHYLNRYTYWFKKDAATQTISVLKIFGDSEPLPWASYPSNQFRLVEWDLMSKILLPNSYYTIGADIFSGVVKSVQAEFCLICKGCVDYGDDFTDRMRRIEEIRDSLHLARLEILPICDICASNTSEISRILDLLGKKLKRH